MQKIKELQTASDTYTIISTAHDLTARQGEAVKEVRIKALEEMGEESRERTKIIRKGTRGLLSLTAQHSA